MLVRKVLIVAAGLVVIVAAALSAYFLLQVKTPKQAVKPGVASLTAEKPLDEAKTKPTATPKLEAKHSPSDDDAKAIKIYGTVTDSKSGSPVVGAKLGTLSSGGFPGATNPMVKRMLKNMSNVLPEDSEQVPEEYRAKFKDFKAGKISFDELIGGDAPKSEAVTDATGAYSLTLKMDADNFAGLRCTASGYATQEKKSEDKGVSIRLDFLLAKGARVSGKVLDADTGKGIPNATVSTEDVRSNGDSPFNFMDRNAKSGPEVEAKSDADGAYTLEGLDAGNYRVRVSGGAEGFIEADKTPVIVNLDEGTQREGVNLTLAQGGVIEGTVRDSGGQPIKEANVSVSKHGGAFNPLEILNGESPMESDTTDESGHFKVVGLKFSAEYIVSAKHKDFATASTEALQLAKGTPSPRVDIVLTKGSTLSGIAKRPNGTPVPKADLYLRNKNAGPMDMALSGGFQPKKSGDDGRFTIAHVAAGDYTLASDPTFGFGFMGGSEKKTVDLSVDGKTDINNIEVIINEDKDGDEGPKSSIKGKVVDSQGKPASTVSITARAGRGFSRQFGSAITDKDGAFKVDDITEGTYTIEAKGEGGIASAKDVKTGSDITLTLAPRPTVKGVVLDATGSPVEGCTVKLTKVEAGNASQNPQEAMMAAMNFGQENSSTTDASGSFTLGSDEAGTYIVKARSKNKGAGESESLALAASATPTQVTITLEAGVPFSGVAYDPSGNPLSGVKITLTLSEGGQFAEMMTSFMPEGMGLNTTGSAVTDEHGAFTISNIPAGKYQVSASHPTYASFRQSDVDVPKRTGVTSFPIHMAQGGGSKGTYAVDGKPIANAMIILIGPAGSRMVTTDSQGQFEVSGLPAGTYLLQTQAGGPFGGGDGYSTAARKVEITDGQITPINLGDGAGVKVSGKITGASLPKNMIISVQRADQKKPEMNMNNMSIESIMDMVDQFNPGTTAMAHADGTFSMVGITPGDYNVEVRSMDSIMQGVNNPDANGGATAFQPPPPLATQRITVTDKPLDISLNLDGK